MNKLEKIKKLNSMTGMFDRFSKMMVGVFAKMLEGEDQTAVYQLMGFIESEAVPDLFERLENYQNTHLEDNYVDKAIAFYESDFGKQIIKKQEEMEENIEPIIKSWQEDTLEKINVILKDLN